MKGRAAAAAALVAVAGLAVAAQASPGRGYRDPRAAAAAAPHCYSQATRVLEITRRRLPAMPLPRRLKRDLTVTRLYLVTYLLLEPDAVDKPGRHSVFAYVARPRRDARWRLAACGTGPRRQVNRRREDS